VLEFEVAVSTTFSRILKRGHIHHKQSEVTGGIAFIDGLFDPAAA